MRPLTPKRQIVFDIIESATLPLSSQEIFAMKREYFNLATVYRTLNYLEKKNLIEAFSLFAESKGTVRFYFRKSHPHLHFFFCRRCQSFTPFHDCLFSEKTQKGIEAKYKHNVS